MKLHEATDTVCKCSEEVAVSNMMLLLYNRVEEIFQAFKDNHWY